MKIVYVVHGYTNSGGTERVLANKVNYLVEHGYDVSIVSIDKDDREAFFYFNPKIATYVLNLPNETKFKTIILDKIKSLLLEIRPDISISAGLGIAQYLYEINDGSKKILEFHFAKYKRKFELAALDKYFLGRVLTSVYSFRRESLARKYDRFIVLTEEDKKDWRGVHNISVIPNPISFTPNSYSDTTAKKVIAVGRYTYQKGFDKLIDIWSKVCSEFPDWKLSIYGSGRKLGMLESLIKKKNLSNSVELLPPARDIQNKFAESSVFVLTSRYEGQPLVLLEAMTCGLPSVAYACKCGPRDTISDEKDGFLVDTFDEKVFVEKLSLLLRDQDLRKRMGEMAKRNVQRYNLENIMPKWIELFNELIAEN